MTEVNLSKSRSYTEIETLAETETFHFSKDCKNNLIRSCRDKGQFDFLGYI